MKKIINTGFVLAVLILLASCTMTYNPGTQSTGDLKKFSSLDELKDFLKESGGDYGGGFYRGGIATMDMAMEESAQAPMAKTATSVNDGGTASDFSQTNVQVEGVDEADIVKNDGKYIYVLTQNKIAIVNAYPADDAELVSEIEIKGNPREFFINGDKLIVFGTGYRRHPGKRGPMPMPLIEPAVAVDVAVESGSQEGDAEDSVSRNDDKTVESLLLLPDYVYDYTYAKIYDITDRENPKEEEQLILRGYYYNSRMIGNIVYMISNEYAHYRDDIIPPCVYSVKGEEVVEKCMPAPEIYYFDYPDSYEFSTIMAINLEDNSHEEKTVLKGTSQTMYVSQDNIYITFQQRMPYYYRQMRIIEEGIMPFVNEEIKAKVEKIKSYEISESSKFNEIQQIVQKWMFEMPEEKREEIEEDMQEKVIEIETKIHKELEKTTIQKISIDGMDITPEESGEVPGRALNQFSMDEHDGYFRIATTLNLFSRQSGSNSLNNVYVLDEEMDTVGKLEDLAPGERIYSARFMGEKLYLVTFRNIDPLFVIDLADPQNPEVLGKLKIPGYSDYLHPYDENHIIGIGKETIEDKEKDIAWQQGVKLALFDVSDVEKPKEISKFEIGDRGTESYALHDHKAFLFSGSKNLLVIPVTVAEIDEEKYPEGVSSRQYGDHVFQGAYIFNLDLDEGFELKGRITHVEDKEKFKKSGYYWYGSGENVKRSLYMDDVLYTISDSKIKMNNLEDLEEINYVKLPYEEPRYEVWY